MFGRYFAQTFTGSMAGIGVVTHAVWGYCIANARIDGTLELNAVTLSAILGECSPKQVSDSIKVLCSPDAGSRTPTKEGRKLEQISTYEYRIVNYEVFKAIKTESARREYNRLKKQESRARKALAGKSVAVAPEKSHEKDAAFSVEPLVRHMHEQADLEEREARAANAAVREDETDGQQVSINGSHANG